MRCPPRAATRKHTMTMVGQKYFKGGGKQKFGGQKYAKFNKINNNSEKFRRARLLLWGDLPP